MDSRAILKEALRIVRKVLKGHGFSNHGLTFHRTAVTDNIELVSLQQSIRPPQAESLVTMNYGVYCTYLGNIRGEASSALFDLSRAHWRERWAEAGQERWLRVRSGDGADGVARVMIDALDSIVLPELRRHSANEALRDTWLAGLSPGITGMQRLLFLALLLKKTGPADRLDSVVGELRKMVAGTAHAGLVDYDLSRAGLGR
jgi:hypothetical protein